MLFVVDDNNNDALKNQFIIVKFYYCFLNILFIVIIKKMFKNFNIIKYLHDIRWRMNLKQLIIFSSLYYNITILKQEFYSFH